MTNGQDDTADLEAEAGILRNRAESLASELSGLYWKSDELGFVGDALAHARHGSITHRKDELLAAGAELLARCEEAANACRDGFDRGERAAHAGDALDEFSRRQAQLAELNSAERAVLAAQAAIDRLRCIPDAPEG